MRKSYFAQFSRNLGFCVFRCFLKFLIIIWLLFTLIKYSSYERIHHIVQKIPIFVHYFWNYKHEFMRKIMENLWLILYSCVISCKNDFFSNESALSCKTGYALIQNWCEISCKKVISCKNMKSLGNGIYCFVEEPSDGQKPP